MPSFRNFTKSTMPPAYWNTSVRGLPSASVTRSSYSTILRPLLRNAISRKRFARVSKSYTVVSVKISGSGQNDTVVPLPRFVGPTSRSFSDVLPWSKPMKYSLPSLRTCTSTREDSAFTTETPTPCRPPDTL